MRVSAGECAVRVVRVSSAAMNAPDSLRASLAQRGVPVGPQASPSDALPVLDDPGEWSAFSRPVKDSPGCWESHVVFEGMHCAACAVTIEDALRHVPGVQSIDVSSGTHRGRIVWDEARTRPSEWMGATQRVGYRALPAGDTFVSERRKAETRRMLWRWLVAGLCMMQVMMYATPSYVAKPGDMSPDAQSLLRWASWVLSVPVVLFSCGPFFSSALRDLRHRTISMDLPVALGMALTFVVSTLGTFEPNGIFGREVYFDSLTMFVFFLLTGRLLELRLRDRTAGALEVLMNRLPDSVERRRADGQFERVAVRRLVLGDVVRVLPGESFPADGTLLEGRTQVDEALLTGESKPRSRAQGSVVIAGSYNLAAPVVMRVDALGEGTRYAQIVALMEEASVSKPRIAQLADRLARPFLVGVLLAAAGAAAFWWRTDPAHAVMIAVAVLVVTCPCALSLATPAAMLAAAGRLARDGVLVRRLQALEAMAAVDTVVFDKTGTLTRDAFVLTHVDVREGFTPELALALAALLGRQSLHPVSRALVASAQARGLSTPASWRLTRASEVPGHGVDAELMVDEPSSPGLRLASALRLGSGAFCAELAGSGSSPTPAPAGDASTLHTQLADARGWLASFYLHEDVRADASERIDALHAAQVRVAMLSGDAPNAARRVAQTVGIDEVRGHCTPQDKLDWIRQAQAQGRQVAMVGDGLNDGPVLAGANVSFAFGSAVPLAQAQADFVVLGERLGQIGGALQLARRTMRVVKQNLRWAAAYNAVGVPLAVAGLMPAWLAGLGMALSSLLVVLNALRLAR